MIMGQFFIHQSTMLSEELNVDIKNLIIEFAKHNLI